MVHRVRHVKSLSISVLKAEVQSVRRVMCATFAKVALNKSHDRIVNVVVGFKVEPLRAPLRRLIELRKKRRSHWRNFVVRAKNKRRVCAVLGPIPVTHALHQV